MPDVRPALLPWCWARPWLAVEGGGGAPLGRMHPPGHLPPAEPVRKGREGTWPLSPLQCLPSRVPCPLGPGAAPLPPPGNPNLPSPSSPDPPPSQNPLSLMMSQMSKYAMPSSTPLYHNAIKTIATSDDELLPDRPMLPPGGMAGRSGGGGGADSPAAAGPPLSPFSALGSGAEPSRAEAGAPRCPGHSASGWLPLGPRQSQRGGREVVVVLPLGLAEGSLLCPPYRPEL